jgi:hypothetical protein
MLATDLDPIIMMIIRPLAHAKSSYHSAERTARLLGVFPFTRCFWTEVTTGANSCSVVRREAGRCWLMFAIGQVRESSVAQILRLRSYDTARTGMLPYDAIMG